MTKILFVNPWKFQDENSKKYTPEYEWRNGPYSLLLLATILRVDGHQVALFDTERELVREKGDTNKTLFRLSSIVQQMEPDIIGISFFSVQFIEAQIIVSTIREVCEKKAIQTKIIAGGIHSTIEPESTLHDIPVDFVFVGEGEIGLRQLAAGCSVDQINGLVGKETKNIKKGDIVADLDSLPFPDWSLCDYKFYAYPSYGKIGYKKSSSLDVIMGRGCLYKCNFCAYPALSKVRTHSAEYLYEQCLFMIKKYGIKGIFFTDSSLGNNTKTLVELCNKMISSGLNKRFEWYGCMRSNQINEELLKLMWIAGCRSLFYGFESGSQAILDRMNKRLTVEDNIRAAELHKKLQFPYHASFIYGYPGETEDDLTKTLKMIQTLRPTVVGHNRYVPLPGSPDYMKLKIENKVCIKSPLDWRLISTADHISGSETETFKKAMIIDEIQKASNRSHYAYKNSRHGIFKSSELKWASEIIKTKKQKMKSIVKKTLNKFFRENNKSVTKQNTVKASWDNPFEILRRKWGEIPAVEGRVKSSELVKLDSDNLAELWRVIHAEATTGEHYSVRGWYHDLYGEWLSNKKIMDYGSGLGIDSIFFAQKGADVTFVDIVETNLQVIDKICKKLEINNYKTFLVTDFHDIDKLDYEFDVIWCQGSLINTPIQIVRKEVHLLLPHLKNYGRWIELAYPEERWIRDGRLAFDKWGELTDGGAPWIEWKDMAKMVEIMKPYKFDIVLSFNFHNNDFNWFDLKISK